MYTKEDILKKADELGIIFDSFTLEDLIIGINIELEHGKINPKTNITNNDLEMTIKIALAHLNEFPDYYDSNYGLPAFEKSLKEKRTYYLK